MTESIKKYKFKDGLRLEFEIIDLSQILKSKKNLMTVPHRAQFYHILWIEKGEGTHIVDFNPIKLEDNTLILSLVIALIFTIRTVLMRGKRLYLPTASSVKTKPMCDSYIQAFCIMICIILLK